MAPGQTLAPGPMRMPTKPGACHRRWTAPGFVRNGTGRCYHALKDDVVKVTSRSREDFVADEAGALQALRTKVSERREILTARKLTPPAPDPALAR